MNYNQRQQVLKELSRLQDKEADLAKAQSALDKQIRLYDEKAESMEKLITLRVEG